MSKANFNNKTDLNKLGSLLTFMWSLLLAVILIWNWVQIKETAEQEALIALEMTVEKDLSFRFWAAKQGGIYIPLTEKDQPVSYLSHIENRDIITTTGEELTLVNPATMMRQIYQLQINNSLIHNRQISLRPLNPSNTPDPWEAKALLELEKNTNLNEVSGIDKINDHSALRFVAPLYIEEECLKCHAHQGYEIGDLRGGLSVSTPFEPYLALIRSRQIALLPGYALIWLVGFVGIGLFMGHIKALTASLSQNEARLEYLSFHDKLTGLHNRNFFERELNQYSNKGEYPVSIISADVNGLKLINDSLGHPMGDQLLINSGKVLKQSLRSSDILARIGGDEFVIILPGTNEKEGKKIIGRMQEEIKKHNENYTFLPLSIAMGIATAENTTEDLIETYKLADDQMYQDKLQKRATVKQAMINALISSAKDKEYTDDDYLRLKELCHKMGVVLGFDRDQLERLSLFAQVKDLGKIIIDNQSNIQEIDPDKDLADKGEEALMEHPEKGYRIANALPELLPIADLILKHREKWDGSGYPLGLKGEEIPIKCRIQSIADTYVALTGSGGHGETLSTSDAIARIKKGSGTEFDPKLVEIFLSIINV